ncbi:hypothetical protein DVS28_b0481 (plasmid) [Euzebya pacifica]|uniref:Uncharacterized protein n=1 Tax=Euzebya pacifica TaxID=1608957 RepID=A0A346Y6X4_9ACTN|nr:hypothetical protein [Euzebya pacifica]AXV10221.1 hypothetical protein DVS28_b0481 [Euzebya pacifica]
MRLSLKKHRPDTVDDLTDDEIPVVDPADTETEAVIPEGSAALQEGASRGYMMPANAFDMLEGKGRSTAATRQMNIIIIGIVLLVIAASAYIAQSAISTRDDLTTQLATLENDIDDTVQAIRQRSSSILPEATLASHRDERRQIILDAFAEQLPYEVVFADVTTIAEEVGVTVERLTFDGSERDDGLVVAGTAPNLEVLGLWSTELTNRHGIARRAGYIETVTQTYQDDQNAANVLTFNTRMRVNTSKLSMLTGCRRVETFLDNEVPDCAEVLEELGDFGLPADGEFGNEAAIDPTVPDPAADPAEEPAAEQAAEPADTTEGQ